MPARHSPLTRREFLKLSLFSLGGLAFRGLGKPLPPDEDAIHSRMVGRVATSAIYLYQEPDFRSSRLALLQRDTLLYLSEEIISPAGPVYNPHWYRLFNGYVHSGYVQRVEGQHLNPVLQAVPEGGKLGEITVPYTRCYRGLRRGWQPLYRLYYSSVHWITAILERGPEGRKGPWYELKDERLGVRYAVPARHVRPIAAGELTPISPQVDPDEKQIDVSLSEQRVRALESDEPVFQADVSTGNPWLPSNNDIPTGTPEGHFRVTVKVPSKHMGNGDLTDDLEAYELPGVPWVCFFHAAGIAFHGAYWHDSFGRMLSHGCINMRSLDALWLYRWTTPAAGAAEWNVKGNGTRVHIHS